TVTRGGEKLTWPEDGYLLVIFIPQDRERDPNVYRATATDLGASTYRIDALPPGKYAVAVQQFDLKHMDALGGAYDPSHTTLEKEVPADGGTVDIDVPKPAGGNGGGGPGRRGGRPRGGPGEKGGDPAKADGPKD